MKTRFPRIAAGVAAPVFAAALFAAAPALGQAQPDGFFTLTGGGAAGYAAPSDTTLVRSMPIGRLGVTMDYYQQTFGGAEVLGGLITIHRDADGNVVRVIGAHYPGIAASNSVRVTAAGARGLVDRDIGPDGRRDVTLMIDPDSGEFFWRVETRRDTSRWVHWIGAENGATLNKYDALTNQGCTTGDGYGMEWDRTGGTADFKILDCLITPAPSGGAATQLRNARQETRDQGSSRRPFLSGAPATDGDDHWNILGRESPGTAALVDAHYYMALADSYFLTQYSFDFNARYPLLGGRIPIHAHFTKNYVNAFWNSSYFGFGDGDGVQFDPLTSLDVAVHEFAHSVTEAHNDLIYQNESGALNESLSDIVAATVERLVDSNGLPPGVSPRTEPDPDLGAPGSEWLVGEDFDLVGDGFRNMANPAADGDPTNYADRYTGTGDNGGVHINSGIPNHAFYRLVTGQCGAHSHDGGCSSVAGVDIQRAADVFYLGFLSIPANGDFCDARAATTLVAGAEAAQVTAAWDHVGVTAALCGGTPVDNPPNASWSATCDNALGCVFTDSSTDDGTIASWDWNFGDGNSSTAQNPSHTYATPGTYNVSLTVTDNAGQTDVAQQGVTASDGSGAVVDVTGISPGSMNVTESPKAVTISGSGFGDAGSSASVTFLNGSGPTPVATEVTVVNDTTITANVSASSKGKKGEIPWDVLVTTSNGQDTAPNPFKVTR
ncbi:MAG TPA: M4 family metallopeptidase [Thermohalobaculum sp.]|nr:M4 family metallopeptidase [Thermohalobaculum sp.]